MATKASPNRLLQFAAFGVTAIFVAGFVYSALGAWTGAILGAWFVGTQKPWRGFLWLVGINVVLSLVAIGRGALLNGIAYASWSLLAILIGTLPFLLYRLTCQRRPGFVSTLSLPLWGVALQWLGQWLLPANIFKLHSLAQSQAGVPALGRIGAMLGTGAIAFLVYWFGAVVIWIWNLEFRGKKIAVGASVFCAVCVVVLGYGFFLQIVHPVAPHALLTSTAFAWICFAGGLLLSGWSLIWPSVRREVWANKNETLALLRSPYTGDSLQEVSEGNHEVLVSKSGERFPVRDGIPVFLEPEKLTGSNQKYNQLYETIGGFYDDIQRVACALRGVSPSDYFWDYLRFLEIHPGDSMLETSIGTGLNYKYLPRGIQAFGLDLSMEMLTNCQANLRRWELAVELFQGNAEELPFADNSFDVVFHVGGINFFNDRAKAIREMIRVAKPGSRLLIADETEEHVKSAYERSPVIGRYFKKRQEAVAAPIDMVPTEMWEIHLELLRDGQFYALTFRKPGAGIRTDS